MTKKTLGNYLNQAISYLLFVFIVCEHHVKFTAIKNLSLYTALFLGLVIVFIDKKSLFDKIYSSFKLSAYTLSALLLFCGYAFLVSLFPYDDTHRSLGEAFSEFGRGIAFLLVILILSASDKERITTFFYAFLAAFLCITLYYASPLLSEFDKISSKNIHEGRIIIRAYADYVDRFLPFALVGLVLIRALWVKFALFGLCLLALIMDILSGTRGSWLSVCTSVVAVLAGVCFSSYRHYLKKHFKMLVVLALIAGVIVSYVAINSSIFEYKISQNHSSGRDIILKDRLPLLFQSHRAYLGLGHGKAQYDQFLRDEMDKGAKIRSMLIRKDTKERYWFNDEPFFIGNYFYYGVFGTSALVLAFVFLLLSSLKEFKKTQNLLYLAIAVSAFSYFGVRGLFECINLRILYLFYLVGFFVLLNSYHNKRENLHEDSAFCKR